jgi:flagellar hook-associated protein 3 FlgL
MASGDKIDLGSDDAMIHAEVVNIQDKIRVTDSLKLQLSKTEAMNTVADKNMAEFKNVLDLINQDILKGLNSGMTRSDKLALATNLEGMRGNLLDLTNTHVDGEYIFSGSDTTQKTMIKDSNFVNNGQVEFEGDGFLRKVAVQPGSYRDRGVTAYDVSHYTSSRALVGENFTFSAGERIIDEDGFEWKVMDASGVPYNKDDGGATSPNFLQKFDHNGKLVDNSLYPEAKIPIISTTAAVEATATNQATQETYTIQVIGGTAAGQQPDSRVFEAKHNYFDDINILINAYKGHSTKLDGTKGPVIQDNLVDDTIRTQLEISNKQFDATNIGHGELGGRNKVFELANEKIVAQETHYNILMKETNGADMAKLAMESKALDLTYQALFSTISKMNDMSLVKFVK